MALNGDGIVAGAFTEATSSPTPPGAAKATMALSTFDPRSVPFLVRPFVYGQKLFFLDYVAQLNTAAGYV